MCDLTDNQFRTNMFVYTLEQRWEVGLRSTEVTDFRKKLSFQMKLILILAGM